MSFTTRTTQLANVMRSTIWKHKRNYNGKGKQPSDSSNTNITSPRAREDANAIVNINAPSSSNTHVQNPGPGPGRGITESNSLERVPEDEGPLSFSQLLRRSDREEDMRVLEDERGNYDEDEDLRVDVGGYEYTGTYKALLRFHILISTLTFILISILFYLPFTFSYFLPSHRNIQLFQETDVVAGHNSPSRRHIFPTILLSASIWTLAHNVKIPIFSFLSFINQSFLYDSYIFTIIPSIIIYTSIQELLRLSSFLILNLHLHPSRQITHITFHHPFFITTYFVAFGWALAEIIALTYQAFSQLYLYKEVLPSSLTDIIESVATPGVGAVENAGARYVQGILERSGVGQEIDSKVARNYGTMTTDRGRPVVRRVSSNAADTRVYQENDGVVDPSSLSIEQAAVDENVHRNASDIPVVENDDREDHNTGYKAIDMIDVDQEEANGEEPEDIENLLEEEITRLVNLKKREDLEEIYGVAFVDIPIFLIFLQRVNSIILSYGLTLLLSFAYLSSLTSRSGPALFLPLMYLTVVIIHSMLSSIHAPSILPRIGIHTAAYVSLVMGLGVFFAGLGFWGVVS